jgi:hypothetical protein
MEFSFLDEVIDTLQAQIDFLEAWKSLVLAGGTRQD